MQFQLRSFGPSGKTSHCGVLEFTADEGKVFVPHWVMSNLLLQEGEMVTLRSVQLPKGTFVKFRPHSKDFLEITNHRAVLEKKLSSYSCVTVGDVMVFNYAGQNYALDILEAKPASAVSIVETDCEVDFAPPADYVEPDYKAMKAAAASSGAAGAGGAKAGAAVGASRGAASASSLGGVAMRGDGSSSNPIVFDDDDDDSMDMGGSAMMSVSPFTAGGVTTASGESSTKRYRQSGDATAASAAAAAPSPIGVPAAATGPSASPKVPSFSGAGRRLSDGPAAPSGSPSSSPAASGAGAGGPPPSPSLHPIAGGVVLSGGVGGPAPKPQRSLNRFEQQRAAASFGGQGRTLR